VAFWNVLKIEGEGDSAVVPFDVFAKGVYCPSNDICLAYAVALREGFHLVKFLRCKADRDVFHVCSHALMTPFKLIKFNFILTR